MEADLDFFGVLDSVLRVIILLLTNASFQPQLRSIYRRRWHCDGISPGYALLNLISATHQFSLVLFFVANHFMIMDGLAHTPPSFGDWLNLFQCATVWLYQLLFCGLVLRCSTAGRRAALTCAYAAFLLISLVPVIVISTQDMGPPGEAGWFPALWSYPTTVLVNPVITVLTAVSYFPQASATRRRAEAGEEDPGALSVYGLGCQAVVFGLAALAWAFRLRLGPLSRPGGSNQPEFDWGRDAFGLACTWYQLAGWAAVDNGVYAVVQGCLFLLARGLWPGTTTTTGGGHVDVAPERQPLLDSQGGE